jgi:hypothetical protein
LYTLSLKKAVVSGLWVVDRRSFTGIIANVLQIIDVSHPDVSRKYRVTHGILTF